jgi:hypothetical protein
MKRIIFAIALLLPVLAIGQRSVFLPPPSEVAPEYRKEYRASLKEFATRYDELKAAGYDIILDDLSSVPVAVALPGVSAQTNWGKDLLSPADLQARILNECTKPVRVKIMDTAGALTHPDLQEGQRPGSSYTGEPTLTDGNGHGTHCAGIIAGKDIGLAYGLVKKGLLTFEADKVLTDAGGGSFTWVSQCYAAERAEDVALRAQGVAVIYSGSFGGGTAIIPAVETELQKSVQAGAYFIFAAGNTGGPVNYPAMSPYAIATASLDQSIVASSYSSRGPEVLAGMPGRNINSTYKDGTYAVLSGTSMATPFLSAAAAIALSKWGIALLPTQEALRAYLSKIATDIPPTGRDDATGYGIAYIRSILDTQPVGTPPPPPPPPPTEPAPSIQVQTTVDDGFVIRYRFVGDQKDRILQVKSITMFTSATTAESSIEQARAYCREYFPSHQIVEIPVKDGLDGAAFWAGQFFEYWGKNNNKPLQIDFITVADEQGRSFVRGGFDRAELPESYEGSGPRLVKIQ